MLNKEKILGLVRHTLTFVGAIYITKGLIDETLVTEIVGGAITLTSAIWSIVSKNKNK